MTMTDITNPAIIIPSLPFNGGAPAPNRTPRDADGIRQVAEDFEAFYAGLVFDQMSSDIEPDPVTGGGEGEAMFKSLLNQEFGKSVARTHSLGIADVVQRQLLQMQEVQ